MDQYVKKINDLEDEIGNLRQTIQEMEFRQDLLFYDSSVNRLLYEYKITKEQYNEIMDLMDRYRNKIDKKQDVHHGTFEQEIYNTVPHRKGDYHFCEYLTIAFKEENRWEEVFDALYGDMPKYKNKG
ncbi:DUF1878 domain-containing protein [Bacillus sp. UNC438CL73TsuS30]|uniref:DUF1878 domain-containing protein n=1 Tax=Bacillus sp. UNC438CL73TsuS30 TaxID=1340434 RepID=UPI000ABE93F0|nr:DUF1878 domain-containing protein [Bacillus sp. UNC438CL73TsuS30]